MLPTAGDTTAATVLYASRESEATTPAKSEVRKLCPGAGAAARLRAACGHRIATAMPGARLQPRESPILRQPIDCNRQQISAPLFCSVVQRSRIPHQQ